MYPLMKQPIEEENQIKSAKEEEKNLNGLLSQEYLP